MNIRHHIVILGAAMVFLPVTALADNSGWYVAADVGQSHFTGNEYPKNTFVTRAPFTDTDTGYRLAAGYQFNSYWGLEASYLDFGQITGKEDYVNPGGCMQVCFAPSSYYINEGFKTYGWSFEFTGTYPFNEHWSVFARAGAIDARSDSNVSDTPIPPYESGEQTFYTSYSSTNLSSTYGFGINWAFADRWGVRLSLDRYSNLLDDHNFSGTYSVNLATLGVFYRF